MSRMFRRPFARFIVLTYVLSTPFWIFNFIAKDTSLPLNIPIGDIAAACMPLVAACLLAWREGGVAALKRLLARIFDYKKMAPKHFVWVIILPVVLYATIYGILHILAVDMPPFALGQVANLLGLLAFFYVGSILEETGYTAYATDTLLGRHGVLATALIIGVPWALWHVPSMLVQGRAFDWIAWGVLGTVAFRYIYVALYMYTNRSVAAVIMLHTFFNFARVVFPQSDVSQPLVQYEAVHYGAVVVFAVFLGALWRRQTNVRGKIP